MKWVELILLAMDGVLLLTMCAFLVRLDDYLNYLDARIGQIERRLENRRHVDE